MKLTRFLAISVIAASTGLGLAQAQSISERQIPAEFPPASFKGKQFVDSRGCVYIRAGVDGTTTWVPRVTRDRAVICGFKPTFAPGTAAAVAAPELGKNVVQIQPAAPEKTTTSAASAAPVSAPRKTATPVAVAPAPTASAPRTKAPKTTVKTRTAKQPLYTTATAARPKTVAPSAAPVVIVPATPPAKATKVAPAATAPVAAAPVTTAPVAKPRRTTSQPPRVSGIVSPCREGLNTYKGMSVRCGPQAQSPVTPGTGRSAAQPPKMQFDQNSSLLRPPVGTVVRAGEVAPDVRVVPRHVYEANAQSHVTSEVPEGYRRAFDDGRLSETRAFMTFAGQDAMRRVWTDELPRQLVPVSVDDTATQGGGVARNAQAVPQTAVAPTAVSTKAAEPTKALRLSGTPYVQVGPYQDVASAQAAAKQLRRAGLPVRIGKYTRNGATQRIVLAGPFADARSAQAGVATAQNAGFGNAFLRQ